MIQYNRNIVWENARRWLPVFVLCKRFCMKVCIVQPAYSADFALSDEYFKRTLSYLEACDESMDIVVFPEDSDQPCYCATKEQNDEAVKKYNEILLKKASETAKRCHCLLFINARHAAKGGFRNTTYAFDREGKIAGFYDKQHLVPSESNVMRLDDEYSFSPTFPTVLTIEGIRFAFLTCYDFYFYENYSNIARFYPDVIIGCSHQRSDPQHYLECMSSFLAYNTNAYVLRSSVSMGENSTVGGGSMIVSPAGKILLNMKSRVGAECLDIDLSEKFYKPSGYGNPPGSHFDYCEKGRRPYKYRPAGPFIARNEEKTSYPRSSSHDGFFGTAPKGSLCAVGAALAADCTETLLTVRVTFDKKAVVCPERNIQPLSDGKGPVDLYSLGELRLFDFGKDFGEDFSSLPIATLEDMLKKYACHTLFTLHLKRLGIGNFDKEALSEILSLLFLYDNKKHTLFLADNEKALCLLKEYAPDIPRAICVKDSDSFEKTLDTAEKYGCVRIVFESDTLTAQKVQEAHERGLYVSVLHCDTEEKVKNALEKKVDVVVSDRCRTVSNGVKNRKNEIFGTK